MRTQFSCHKLKSQHYVGSHEIYARKKILSTCYIEGSKPCKIPRAHVDKLGDAEHIIRKRE